MYISVITPPATQSVTLAEAKAQCRLTETDTTHDTLLLALIEQAAATIDTMTGCKTSSQVLELTLDGFPSSEMDLGTYPVTSITSVTYDDADDAEQTLTADDDYYTGLSSQYPKIYPVAGWPSTSGKAGTVRVRFVAGYTTIPSDLKLAILMRVSELFNNPSESTSEYDANPTINSIKAIVGPYRTRWLAK